MNYEKECARLQRLLDEVDSDIQYEDEESEDEQDEIEVREEDSATEQEGNSSEEEIEIPEKKMKCSYYTGRDKISKWNKHCPSKRVRTLKSNIIMKLPCVANFAKQSTSILDT